MATSRTDIEPNIEPDIESWYWQMLPGQMLPWQMSPWQLESVLDVPRSLPLKFHQNRVSNSWDIADFEFVWVVGGGGGCKVIFP